VGIVREAAGGDFHEYYTEGKDVRWEIKLVTQKNLRRHVCVCATKGETTGLFLVASGDASKSKVGDLETTVRGKEQILALEVTMYAFAGVKVCEGTGDVGCKRKSETPG